MFSKCKNQLPLVVGFVLPKPNVEVAGVPKVEVPKLKAIKIGSKSQRTFK